MFVLRISTSAPLQFQQLLSVLSEADPQLADVLKKQFPVWGPLAHHSTAVDLFGFPLERPCESTPLTSWLARQSPFHLTSQQLVHFKNVFRLCVSIANATLFVLNNQYCFRRARLLSLLKLFSEMKSWWSVTCKKQRCNVTAYIIKLTKNIKLKFTTSSTCQFHALLSRGSSLHPLDNNQICIAGLFN